MIRFDDWPARLTQYLIDRAPMPFAWGTNDCATFAADAVIAMTDEDPIAEFRSQWNSALSGRRLSDQVGGLAAFWDSRFTQLQGPLFAQRGDIGVMPFQDGWQATVVCTGSHWAGPAEIGMLLYPLDACVTAWAVGRPVSASPQMGRVTTYPVA